MRFAVGVWWLDLLLFAGGVFLLVKGSDWFVEAAAACARRFGVSEFVIGLTLVSIGTSLPELASSVCASLQDSSSFIIGNIVGSNIANIALILGAALVLGGSMEFDRSCLRRDLPILLAAGVLLMLWFCGGWDLPSGRGFGRIGGAVFLAGCVLYTALLCRQRGVGGEAGEDDGASPMSAGRAAIFVVLGLAMITAGARMMVDTVVVTAQRWGVDPLVISITVVAVGTSLPELAVTISGVLKKRNDIALGNIVGSGIYNLLLIIGCCAAITPLRMEHESGPAALAAMNFIALLLWLFMISTKRLRRRQGWVFLLLYAGFVAWSTVFCR